jgi:hypothetical protein
MSEAWLDKTVKNGQQQKNKQHMSTSETAKVKATVAI